MKKYVRPSADVVCVSFTDVITASVFGAKESGSGADWDWSTPSMEDAMNV